MGVYPLVAGNPRPRPLPAGEGRTLRLPEFSYDVNLLALRLPIRIPDSSRWRSWV